MPGQLGNEGNFQEMEKHIHNTVAWRVWQTQKQEWLEHRMWMMKLPTGIGEFGKLHHNVTLLFCWKIVEWLPSCLCDYPHSFVSHLDLTDTCKVISLLTTVTPLRVPPFCFPHRWPRSPVWKRLHVWKWRATEMLFLPSWFLYVMAVVLLCCRSPVLVLGDPTQYTSPYSEFDLGNETQKPLYSQTDLVMIIHLSFASPYVLVTFFSNCHT